MSKFVVGLTGGIGSGKSAASSYFESLGIRCVDADIVSREVVLPGTRALSEIEKHFGNNVIDNQGELNRKILREIIFHDPDEKVWLEKLLHPLIRERIQLLIANSKSPYTILSSPLLIETKQHLQTDYVLVVDVPENTQLSRTLKRDGGNEKTIKSILSNQLSRTQRLKYADDIIDNSTDLKTLHAQVESLHKKYLDLASKK
ncbi:dephospho-CoA kinase [Sessilibacter corallicola]|uniref:Dephospho-CoA kinase n=1 Tax=Sessilibacter corallicola TaxID=2904075 RepID=A0ABQ0A3R0_9GAMM